MSILTAAVLTLGACGGEDNSDATDDEPSASASPSPTTSSAEPTPAESTSPTTQPAVSGDQLKDCMLAPTLARGVYEPLKGQPSSEIQQLADDAGADLFVLVRESRGIVYYLVTEFPEAAEALVPGVQPTLELIGEAVGAPKKPASGSEGPVAFGVLPITPDENPEQLKNDVGEDLSSCLEELGG